MSAKIDINRYYRGEQGFTLIEVMIAVTVFAVALLALSSMQLSAIRGNSNANWLSAGTRAATEKLETLVGLSYAHADLADTDADGTDQDADDDGIDDDGGNFGMDDNTTLTADHTETLGIYTILWNIAVDQPLPSCKTVQVIVTWNDDGRTKSVTIDSIKAERI